MSAVVIAPQRLPLDLLIAFPMALSSPPPSATPSAPEVRQGAATSPLKDSGLADKDKAPDTRFIVERRTLGLQWSERLGCVVATGVCGVPLLFFCSGMLPVLQQESGFTLLMLSIATALGACVALVLGLAISVFVWWVPRMIYLALHTRVRRKGVRAGVRSRGIWISGIGWMGWNGLHIREKGDKPNSVGPCASIVINSPEHGDIILKSSENVPDLLKQIRRHLDAQATEFQHTEMMPSPTQARNASTKGSSVKDAVETL